MTKERPGPARLDRSWRSLGRPSSLGLRVPLLYAPIGAIGPLLLDRPVSDAGFLAWLWVALAGELVLLACFPVARGLVHGWGERARSRPRPVVTLVAIVACATFRGVAVALLAQQATGTSMVDELSYRVVAAVLFQAGFLVIIALLANERDDHREVVAALVERERQLIEIDATAVQRLASMQRDLMAQVHETIDPPLARLLAGLAGSRDAHASVLQITDLVEREIRPLSHRLASATLPEVGLDPLQGTVHSARSPLPRRLALVDCLLTWPSVWLIFVAAIVGALRNAAAGQQVTFILAMTGTTMLGLLIARRAALRWSPPTPVTLAVVVLLNMALPTFAVWLMHRAEITGANTVAASAAVGTAIGAFSAGYGAVSQGRRLAEEHLRQAVASLEASVSVLRQRAWLARRQLGYLVHGSLQGSLVAAAMRLSSAPEVDQALTDSIVRDVSAALSRLEQAGVAEVELAQALADIASLWSGECGVDWEVDEQCRESLATRPETSACLSELAREAVGNAVRHGGASEVTVRISQLAEQAVLVVADNGTHWDPGARPGLGSRMRDEMCIDWSLVRDGDQTLLIARLALAVEPEAQVDQVARVYQVARVDQVEQVAAPESGRPPVHQVIEAS